MHTSIKKDGGFTIMSFTKYLEEENDNPINIEGFQNFIYANGSSNKFSYHGSRGKAMINLAEKNNTEILAPQHQPQLFLRLME